MNHGKKIGITSATDVLRLAAGISGSDVSLREKPKFSSFKKKVRRFLLSMLEECSNLSEDVARRPEMFKRLFHQLHPGDWIKSYPNVVAVANELYNDQLITFNSKVETLLLEKNPQVLSLMISRPGEFRRRLIHLINLFGKETVKAFTAPQVLKGLTNYQLVALNSQLLSTNDRAFRVFPPKGNWNKMQLGGPRRADEECILLISAAIERELAVRLPLINSLDDKTSMIKLPNNGGDTAPYARGTVFPIPENVKFIRLASYWKVSSKSYIWFDIGCNFFGDNWSSLGACCWSQPFHPGDRWNTKTNSIGAVFSGDPTNSKDEKGRATQLIDLYPEKLLEAGVRYCLSNILCYSGMTFSKAEDVFTAFAMGRGT